MRFLKWGLLFAIAFAAAWVVIFTFNQDPFKIEVPAKILLWQTKSVPVYVYISGAFFIGLLIGLCMVMYEKFSFHQKISKKNKELRNLEKDLAIVTTDLEQCRRDLSSVQEKFAQAEQNKKNSDSSGIEESQG
jgi:uncharacterized integral membrane protein